MLFLKRVNYLIEKKAAAIVMFLFIIKNSSLKCLFPPIIIELIKIGLNIRNSASLTMFNKFTLRFIRATFNCI